MPAFSETYTFRVTSSDGARLMVNGQVLVNDWVDGASRVRTGTVALQANVKYDIRLEYYRNATNAGNVKLEWQSASRARQVVPQAALFTTGSNLAVGLARAQALAQSSNTALSLDPLNARAAITPEGSSYILGTVNSKNFVIGAVSSLSETFIYIRFDNTALSATDLATGANVALGNLSEVIDANGNAIAGAADVIATRLVPLLVKYRGSIGSVGQRPGTVRPQGVPECITPPPSCETVCAEFADTYRVSECSLVGAWGGMVLGAVVGVVAVVGTSGTAAIVFGAAGVLAEAGFVFAGIPKEQKDRDRAWKDYQDNCPDGGCLPSIVDIAPDPVVITALLNTSGSRKVTFRNNENPGSVLRYQSNSSLGVESNGSFLAYLSSTGNGEVPYGATGEVTVSADCGNTAGSGSRNIFITSNAPNNAAALVPVEVHCVTSLINAISLDRLYNCSTTGEPAICAEGVMRNWQDPNVAIVWGKRYIGSTLAQAVESSGAARTDILATYPFQRRPGNWAAISGCPSSPFWTSGQSVVDWYCMGN
jgi:hypothetical protein